MPGSPEVKPLALAASSISSIRFRTRETVSVLVCHMGCRMFSTCSVLISSGCNLPITG